MNPLSNRFRPIAALVLISGVLGCASTTALFAQERSAIPGLSIKVAKLCTRVNEKREPQEEFNDQETIRRGPVSLWTVVSGNRAALRALRARGLLPIRHRWTFHDSLHYSEQPPEDELEDPEPIRVGTIKHLEKLKTEVAQQGAFDWRTWSCKRALRPGIYIVEVVFSNGEPVLDLANAPCSFRFKYDPQP